MAQSNAYLATLPEGAALVVHPDRDHPTMFADVDAALKWLERRGWDYYVTHQQTDTSDEFEQWIPLLDKRRDLDPQDR